MLLGASSLHPRRDKFTVVAFNFSNHSAAQQGFITINAMLVQCKAYLFEDDGDVSQMSNLHGGRTWPHLRLLRRDAWPYNYSVVNDIHI